MVNDSNHAHVPNPNHRGWYTQDVERLCCFVAGNDSIKALDHFEKSSDGLRI